MILFKNTDIKLGNRKLVLVSTFKCSSDNPIEGLTQIGANQVKSIKKQYSKKGYKVFLYSIELGYDGDDFVRNLMSWLLKFKMYKKPRFIK